PLQRGYSFRSPTFPASLIDRWFLSQTFPEDRGTPGCATQLNEFGALDTKPLGRTEFASPVDYLGPASSSGKKHLPPSNGRARADAWRDNPPGSPNCIYNRGRWFL